MQFHATLGVEWEDDAFYEAGLIFPLGDFKPILKIGGPLSDTDNPHVFGAGLIWNGSKIFEFAIGSPMSISDRHLQWGLTGKVTIEF